MLDKLDEIEKTYIDLRNQLFDPVVSTDMVKTISLSKKMSELEEVYLLYQEYKKYLSQKKEAEQILYNENDQDLIDLAKQELSDAQKALSQIEKKLEVALLPQDPNDHKNIFLEIRPAAWWDEAALFAAELLRMYLMYAQKKNWKTEVIENVYQDSWWLKFALVKVVWEKVYSQLKFESGVHRVQRIPETEANGRVHTSTVTVAIMPEAEDVDIVIDPHDITIDTYAASSAWWQNANKNQTWVRIHHKPSWLIVNIGDTKSQLQNKEKAFQVLKARLYQIEFEKKQAAERLIRWNQIWSWDRSEKIRTYNFPQDRLTDHRIKQSWSNLSSILSWEIDDIVASMVLDYQSRMLWKDVD